MTDAPTHKKKETKPLGDLLGEIACSGKARKDFRYDSDQAYEEEMMERFKHSMPALWREFKLQDEKRENGV